MTYYEMNKLTHKIRLNEVKILFFQFDQSMMFNTESIWFANLSKLKLCL